MFIIMGIYMLGSLHTESGATYQSTGTFLCMFSLVFVSELGDKTQLACVALAAESPLPILVFIGAMIGFFVVNSIGAVAGRGIAGAVPFRLIRGATAAVFIVVGVLIVLRIL
jgi:putative Ca2+/H+ antiporter (TMEM165/GDT1 family)